MSVKELTCKGRERMQKNDLWQGGDWERPNPHVSPFIPEIPQQKKKRQIRRPVLIFASMLTLICGLMTATLCARYAPFHRDNGEEFLPTQTQTQQEQKHLPRAKTGTGVTLAISPAGDSPLTHTQVYEKNEHSIVTIYAMDGTNNLRLLLQMIEVCSALLKHQHSMLDNRQSNPIYI